MKDLPHRDRRWQTPRPASALARDNARQARAILALYRPGTADRDDPEVVRALAAVTRDPGLSDWFAKHRALCEALREKFRQIPVPLHSRRALKARLCGHSASDAWCR